MANTNKPYYELSIHSNDEWSDHENLAFTGPTYEAVLAKAKARNVDITDMDKWFVTLWYRIDNDTREVVTWAYMYAVDGTPKWEGEVDLDSDPIPFKLAQKAATKKVA